MISLLSFIIAAVVILYGSWATAANYGNMLFNVACIFIGYIVCKLTLLNLKSHEIVKQIKEYLYEKRKIS